MKAPVHRFPISPHIAHWVPANGSSPGARDGVCLDVHTFESRREPDSLPGSAPQPEIGGDEAEKNHGDDAIHGEKGGIEPAQVAG